jgi:hypothetical protein
MKKAASGKKRLRLKAFWLLFGRQKVTKKTYRIWLYELGKLKLRFSKINILLYTIKFYSKTHFASSLIQVRTLFFQVFKA